MINTLVTILCVIVFFLFGQITQAFKKLLGLLTKIFLKILSVFGIKIETKEKHLRQSQEFRETYKDIKVVKLSKKNIRQKSSMDYVGLSMLLIAIILFIINLDSVSGNVISNWLYSWLSNVPVLKLMFASKETTNTFYTATLFSVISFSISRLVYRWKETKQQRIEAKQAKIKLQAIELMDSKELVEAAKKKDEEKEKELR